MNTQRNQAGVITWTLMLCVKLFQVNCDSELAKKTHCSLPRNAKTTVYDFQVNDIYGNELDWEAYRGKLLLIVNVASF